ncbi:MAG: glycosyltransferase family 2 protein [Bacteroidetes bacterium]|nr:MAG: glycosyltransferase family 2 protein [Bacteroidota bacterium]
MPDLAIVIPCYNPPTNWAQDLLRRSSEFKELIGHDFHLCLVNDASSAGLKEADIQMLQDNWPAFSYITYPTNHGKGYALRQGVKEMKSTYILYTDIDFPYTYESMLAVYEALKDGHHVAVGTRDDIYYENTPARRTLISKVLRWTFRVVFRLPITDTQCGLKGFDQEGKEVFLKTRIERFLFDMEFIALASRNKSLKMVPVAVSLRSDVQFSRMSVRILLTEAVNFFRIFWLTHFT